MIPLYSLSVTEFRRRIRFHPRRKCILFLIYCMQEKYFWPPRTPITGRHAAKLGSYASFLRSVRIIKWQVQRHNVYERSKATACEAHKSPRTWIGCRCCRKWEGLTNRSRIVVPCQIIVSFGVSVFEKQNVPFFDQTRITAFELWKRGKGCNYFGAEYNSHSFGGNGLLSTLLVNECDWTRNKHAIINLLLTSGDCILFRKHVENRFQLLH